jgi:hypothetical protein
MVAGKTTASHNYKRMQSNHQTHQSPFPQHPLNTIYVILILCSLLSIVLLFIFYLSLPQRPALLSHQQDKPPPEVSTQAPAEEESKHSSLVIQLYQPNQHRITTVTDASTPLSPETSTHFHRSAVASTGLPDPLAEAVVALY